MSWANAVPAMQASDRTAALRRVLVIATLSLKLSREAVPRYGFPAVKIAAHSTKRAENAFRILGKRLAVKMNWQNANKIG